MKYTNIPSQKTAMKNGKHVITANKAAVAANYPVGHGGTYREPHGGEFTVPALAWLQWQLQGNEEAAKMFTGFPCGLEQREGWTVEKNQLID